MRGRRSYRNLVLGELSKESQKTRGAPKMIHIFTRRRGCTCAESLRQDQQEPIPVQQSIPVTQVPIPEVMTPIPAKILLPETLEEDEVEVIDIAPQTLVEPTPTTPVVELTTATEIEGRSAEIDAMCRDFLLVGSVNDEDVNAFISSLSEHGFTLSDSNTVDFVKSRLFALDEMAKAEKDAMHSMPNSWREREALRKFEEEEIFSEMLFRKLSLNTMARWSRLEWRSRTKHET